MRAIKIFIILTVVTFLLHFVWESGHIRLYAGYEDLSPHFPVTLFATIGDVFYTLIIVLVFSLLSQSFHWTLAPSRNDYILLGWAGFVVALFVEYKGLALERWYYLPAMPIIPVLDVGLSPILQMTILLPLSVFISSYLAVRLDRKDAGH